MPSGLIEFLVRLGAEPELAAPVADWLRDQAAQQRHDQENARRRIAEEAGQRVLIVQVDDDGQTDVRGFQWFLRTRDLRPNLLHALSGPSV